MNISEYFFEQSVMIYIDMMQKYSEIVKIHLYLPKIFKQQTNIKYQ